MSRLVVTSRRDNNQATCTGIAFAVLSFRCRLQNRRRWVARCELLIWHGNEAGDDDNIADAGAVGAAPLTEIILEPRSAAMA